MSQVTRLLNLVASGDRQASADLLPIVYDELRRLAQWRLQHERVGHTLPATALVHEAYLRLTGASSEPQWDSSGHFFTAAAEAMRRVMVDYARQKNSLRRGGSFHRQDIAKIQLAQSEHSADDILDLNEALQRLEEKDCVKAQLVKLRYFAGLTIPQAAQALGISTTTAERSWAYARAWLHDYLRDKRDL